MKIQRLCVLAAMALAVTAASADSNRIVLRVNDHIATLFDYQVRYSERLRALQAAPIAESERARRLAGLGEDVFREMFDELLMLSRASHLGVEVTEEMVENAVMEMRERSDLLDAERFEEALAQTGMTRADLRDQARRNLLLQAVTSRELQSRVELEEEDLRRYYQGHLEEFSVPRRLRLRSIVVLETSSLDEAARSSLAQEARGVLKQGLDVEAWAKTHSEAGETTDLIDLGWVEQGDLTEELEGAVWGLDSGEVSEPTASRGGLHVVEVQEVAEAHVRPFAEVKEEVRRREMARLQQEALTKMLTEFERQSYVRIDPPPEAAGFRTSRATQDDAFDELQGARAESEEGAAATSGDGAD